MRIAIVKLSAMGDIVHAMVALQYLKTYNPKLEIHWIVEKVFAPLLEHNPHIDKILPLELKAIKKNKKLLFREIKKVKAYAQNDYDLVIDAQGLLKSAITAKLLGKNIIGFSKDSIREGIASYFYTQKVSIAYDANTIDRNAKVLAEGLGLEITPKMIDEKEAFLFYKEENNLKHFLSKSKKNIVFVIGSTWESRNYPKEQFVQVAKSLGENILIVWGNEGEKEKAQWLEAQSPNIKALPKIDLNTLKELIDKADLLIGNDTGPTHIAWGLNIPSITLFGPTPISRVYETKINKVLKSPSKVNAYKLNKEDYSIKEIPVEEIVKIAKGLLYA